MLDLEQLKSQLSKTYNIDKRLDLMISISEAYRHRNRLRDSLNYAETALKIAEDNGKEDKLATIYNLIALYYDAIDQFDRSLDYYHKAKDISEKLGDNESLSTTMNNIGHIYFLHKDKSVALEYYEKSSKLSNNNFKAINNAAIAYAEMGDKDRAETLFQRALDMALERKHDRSSTICYLNLVELSRENGKIERSYNYLDSVKKLLKPDEDRALWIHYLMQRAETSYSDGKRDQAFKDLDNAFLKAQEMESIQFQLNCYSIYKKFYRSLNDYRSAFEYAEKEMELKDKLFRSEIKDKIGSVHALYEVEQRELKAQQMVEKSTRLASIGVMAAGITHEINQPLNAISVSANSVLYWHKQNPDILPNLFIEEVEQISEGVTRIDDIIKHMRSFWVTPNTFVESTIDINRSINSALSLLERQLYSHGIIVDKNLLDREIKIKANPVNIEQIVINLSINGMHALDEIEGDEKRIMISTDIKDRNCILTISDNGKGLPKGMEENLFDPFFSTKEPGKGMGLGLAIVKNLITKMDGNVVAESIDGGGAKFIITIPMEGSR